MKMIGSRRPRFVFSYASHELLPSSLPLLFQHRSLRAIIIMQLIEYLIFYLIIYTFTRTVSIDSKGKIRDRGRDENREIVRFKKSLTIF